ncbi:hypothetical protein EPUS_02640 [Endocarpon pusillum Z07020]|uniref:Uncharacterized protein n=1 Tax=Endocarpon pusillum (strain Z07020 / HMAS-L-300199) TaxID=1263415 RepID=U1GWQ6_ENDPU|nr:uncharacterized protein EPUS_02640 [Endocarpon pusillum Z07020]ERF76928.1 hypothetical protein EPUS_02640 [Endocarpon pusillum Z07020]
MGSSAFRNESEEPFVATTHDANQPSNPKPPLLRETRTISNRGLVAESSPLEGRSINTIPREDTDVEDLFNPYSSRGLSNQLVESSHHTPYPWHNPPFANTGLHDRPQGVHMHNLCNNVHEAEQPDGVATESSHCQHVRQGMQVNGDFFIASNTTHVFPQNPDGSQMLFRSFSNTTEVFPFTTETQTADGESWSGPVMLHPPTTNQPINSASYDDLQTYIAYDMSRLQIDPGAGPREMLANPADLPDWMYKEPVQPSQDPFAEFPRTDSLGGNVDMHSWNCS